MADFLPRRQTDLLTWSTAFKQKIEADPEAYGLTEAQSAEYGAAHDSTAALYALAEDNGTRTPTVIIRKDEAFAVLAFEARKLARIVRAWPGVTAEELVVLGLRPRAADGPSDASRLAPPTLFVRAAHGRNVTIQLTESTGTTRRGKPAHVVGAAVYAAVGGDQAPASLDDFTFLCNTTKPVADITLAAGLAPGTRVWLTAHWLDSRLQPSAAAAPRDVYVGFAMEMAMATLRAAA
jgi:hypothetical protein